MEIGNPNKGGNRKKKNYFSVKQGSQSYRILPPMGTLAKDGIWSRYYEVHFGYENGEGFMRPFQSCEVKSRDRKMIEVSDPATERLKRLKEQLEAITARLKMSPSEALEREASRLDKLVGYPDGQFNLEKKHYMNAINEQGEIGLLQLKHKEKLALEEARKEIEAKYGFDPLGVEGAFITFKKSGGGSSQNTLVQASGTMELQGDQSEKLKRHTVDKGVIARLGDEAFELDKLYVSPTQEEILKIVTAQEKSNEEGQKAITEVFNKYQPPRDSRRSAGASTNAAQQTMPAQSNSSKPDLSVEDKQIAASSVQQQQTQPVQQAAAAQSDDDFLKSIGVPT